MTSLVHQTRDGTAAVLEARRLTKHFAVHGKVPGRRLARVGRAAPVVHAVDDVSLELRAGHVTAVVGESGSGKSTVARLLARLITPTSGQLLLNGHAVPRRRGRRLDYAKTVQMVLQDPFASLNPIHDVHYHLSRPFKVHRLASSERDLEEKITAVLERVALAPADAFMHKYPHELSGGQRQRVGLARSLIARPLLLVADEPTSALDVSVQAAILNQFADLQRGLGFSCLFISHNLAVVHYLCDRIAVMQRGEIVEAGTREQVFRSPSHPYTRELLSATAVSP
jgi:peptide/nickel transport system ATP-binding protein